MYLTLPEQCQGGTVFFRHKPTGDYWLRPERRARYNFDDAAEWEESYRVPMAFNRLVCYPGRLFHAVGTPYFGDTIRNARLTLNLFLDLQDRMALDRQFEELAAALV